MFDLFRRSTRKMMPRTPRPVRLGLERLETRDCPSLISVSVTYGTQKNITLWGDVTGTPNPGGLTVQFTGNATGTATTDSNGHYSASLVALSLGNVYAATTDGASNTAVVTLMVPTPRISNFVGSQGAGNVWTFTGTVSAAGGSTGLTVNFGGDPVDVQNKTATVAADFTFTLIVQMNGTQNDNGVVWARTTDWWNQMSNLVQDYITQTPP